MGNQKGDHSVAGAVLAALLLSGGGLVSAAGEQDSKAPPEKVQVAGEFVMRAETDEAVVVVGFRTVNYTAREKNEKTKEWMLLDVAMTTTSGGEVTITRDDVALSTPDGRILPLASEEDFLAHRGSIKAIEMRDNMSRDSINYLPGRASQPCRIGFFAETSGPAPTTAWDKVELSPSRACLGRMYFHLPEGIPFGKYVFMVKFPGGMAEVPFAVMTKEEEKEWSAKLKQMRKEAVQKKD
jgi:hypothetical protein